MSELTEDYLRWLKKHKRGDRKKFFGYYIMENYKDICMKDMFIELFYEIHKISKKIGRKK